MERRRRPLCSLFLFDGLRRLCQAFHFESFRRLEEGWELILGNVDFSSVHELEDGGEVLEGDILENNDGVLGRVLLQEGLEVGRARRQDHFVGLAGLAVAGQRDVCE